MELEIFLEKSEIVKMIVLSNISKEDPYLCFKKNLDNAILKNQDSIDAMVISSIDLSENSVDSRFVNLKYIEGNMWYFFSNYNSLKAQQFENNNNISALIYWNKISTQIRMKAKIKKASKEFSDKHWASRDLSKNALAISSRQSQEIRSYDDIKYDYKNVFNGISSETPRPDYWGGFYFIPYYFEFWKGAENRLNKRKVFMYSDDSWSSYKLSP